MPRSGSPLVEQILARHPKVVCAGETKALGDALRQYGLDEPEWRYPAIDFIPTVRHIAEISELCLTSMVRVARPARDLRPGDRVTNKMLSNFRYLGLITRLFPNARILHTFRDPIDTCLSCFSINFTSQPFTFDLQELGRYYRGYAILMRHWKRVLPEGAIFDIRYEAGVGDFERSARAIVGHCGLEWDDGCLRFHEAERPVRTASVEQVRRPIYETSVRRWRPDPATLSPLLDGLRLSPAA